MIYIQITFELKCYDLQYRQWRSLNIRSELHCVAALPVKEHIIVNF